MSWNPLLWANVLSLDAPAVALVWQAFFASHLGVNLGPAARFVLAASVWLAYAGDRILDGLRIQQPVLPRHRFAKQHRTPLTLLWVGLLCGTISLAWFALPSPSFAHGSLLLALIAIYFALVHCPGRLKWMSGFKEGAAGILFGLGTVVFLFPEQTSFPGELWLPVGLWCSLCVLNCCAIACWELERDRTEDQESLFTRWSFLRRYLTAGALGLTGLASLTVMLNPNSWMWVYGAIALSSLIITILHRLSGRVGIDGLRVSADLALLTPLLFMVWLQAR